MANIRRQLRRSGNKPVQEDRDIHVLVRVKMCEGAVRPIHAAWRCMAATMLHGDAWYEVVCWAGLANDSGALGLPAAMSTTRIMPFVCGQLCCLCSMMGCSKPVDKCILGHSSQASLMRSESSSISNVKTWPPPNLNRAVSQPPVTRGQTSMALWQDELTRWLHSELQPIPKANPFRAVVSALVHTVRYPLHLPPASIPHTCCPPPSPTPAATSIPVPPAPTALPSSRIGRHLGFNDSYLNGSNFFSSFTISSGPPHPTIVYPKKL